jgi:hypothetical protein
MRCLFGFMCVLALAALPLSVSAQAGEEGTEPSAEEPALPSEPALEEPALQLKLDDAGVEVVPSPPRTADGYTLEEMDLRVKRARIGLLSTMGVSLLGGVLIGIGVSQLDFDTGEGGVLLWTGFSAATGGLIGMMTTGGMLAHRKRKRRDLQEADYRTLHRVQWDLAQSRLVF